MFSHERFKQAWRAFQEMPLDDFVFTEAGWIVTYTHLGPKGSNTILEDWQVLAASLPARYQVWAKSRQVGFSWVSALKGLARAALVPEIYGRPYLGVFLSVSQDEAANKIRYINQAWDTLPSELQKGPLKLVHDNSKGVEFANGSRLISYPAKAVRGESGADIVIDEAAHIPKVKEIYAGTTAAAIRGEHSSISVGSTPLGETGLFAELMDLDGRGTYAAYKNARFYVYWWDSAALCLDVEAARKAAVEEGWIHNRSYEAVRDRLERFAIDRLIMEFESHDLASFLQEYEVAFTTTSNALIPRDVILEAVDPEWPQYMRTINAATDAHIQEIIEGIEAAISKIAPKGPVFGGYDIARQKDQAVLALASYDPKSKQFRVIARVSLIRTRYGVQENLLRAVLQDNRVVSLAIDITGGMGGPLAEKLAYEYGSSRVVGVTFTNTSKHAMASRLASLYSHGRIVHTGDREIIRQVASVRKTITPSGNIRYEGAGEEDHHADVFWALALAANQAPISEGDGPGISGVVARHLTDSPGYRSSRSEYVEWLKMRREGY